MTNKNEIQKRKCCPTRIRTWVTRFKVSRTTNYTIGPYFIFLFLKLHKFIYKKNKTIKFSYKIGLNDLLVH